MSDAGAPVEAIRALAALAEPPDSGHRRLAEALGLEAPSAADHTALFTFELPAYASVYMGSEGWIGGAARDRIAGFWRAVGRTPPAEPDHLSALLGLFAALLEEAAAAPHRDADAGARSAAAAHAAAALLHEHLAPWALHVLHHATTLPCGAYRDWAAALAEVLRSELSRVGPPSGLAAHLAEAPPPADPRREGAGPFVASLLAFARSGVLLTRTGLADVARSVGVGLRLGERRFVLAHLLAQDAAGVLRALARVAEREARLHAAREPWLGSAATHLAARAAASAALLESLATDAEVVAAEGGRAVEAAG